MFVVLIVGQKPRLRWSDARLRPTCVVEEGGDEGAVLEEGVAGGDIFKETLLEQRILEHHRPHLQVHESGHGIEENDWSKVVFCLIWFLS